MVNLIEFTLESDNVGRLLFISPGLLQSKEMPSLPPPIKAYVYENLIKEDFLAYWEQKNINIPEDFRKERIVIKHDQNFEKAYLGYLTFHSDENKRWQGKGSLTNLSWYEIEKLETLLNNYRRDD